tara:strand:+ start:818 stop:1468 length:651 start_codon:yes stop_codon:yes gene_type:complete
VAISKANFNSFNVTPTASKFITFNSSNNGLAADDVGGNLQLISTTTASDDSAISITSGIDTTYKEYVIKMINIHPGTDNVDFRMNLSADGGSNYNVTKTSHFFRASHEEGGGSASLDNATGPDLGQSTGVQPIAGLTIGGDNDQSLSGEVRLFNPSGTTFVKHYNAITQTYSANGDASAQCFVGGYGNTTSAINAIQFTMSSGNIQSGTFKLYGIL